MSNVIIKACGRTRSLSACPGTTLKSRLSCARPPWKILRSWTLCFSLSCSLFSCSGECAGRSQGQSGYSGSWRICWGFANCSQFRVGNAWSITLPFQCLSPCLKVSPSECLSARGNGSLEWTCLLLLFFYIRSFIKIVRIILLFAHPNLCNIKSTFQLVFVLFTIFIFTKQYFLYFFIHFLNDFIFLFAKIIF